MSCWGVRYAHRYVAIIRERSVGSHKRIHQKQAFLGKLLMPLAVSITCLSSNIGWLHKSWNDDCRSISYLSAPIWAHRASVPNWTIQNTELFRIPNGQDNTREWLCGSIGFLRFDALFRVGWIMSRDARFLGNNTVVDNLLIVDVSSQIAGIFE